MRTLAVQCAADAAESLLEATHRSIVTHAGRIYGPPFSMPDHVALMTTLKLRAKQKGSFREK
ncbi:MAG: hypothetical protein ACKVLM_01610 [Pseudomonadales bacterium]